MSTISKNAPCPCGSGKKYKRCHGIEDPKKKTPTGSFIEPPTFDILIEKFSSEPLLKILGVLQLFPINHGHEANFEELARNILLNRIPDDKRPFASWERIQATISPLGYPDDLPTNGFTENAVFSEGNYIVYPGIYVGVTQILNELLECIFLQENTLPTQFVKDVKDGVGLLLFMSNSIAKDMNHVRYMYDEPDLDKITFEEYDTCIKGAAAVTFEKSLLKQICEYIDCDFQIINEFIVPLKLPELEEEDPEENPVSLLPLIENEEAVIVYMPTTITNALLHFIYKKAEQFSCNSEVGELLQSKQFDDACGALRKMSWLKVSHDLPKEELGLPIREEVFRIDNQKIAYLCFIDTLTNKKSFEQNAIHERNKVVVEFLSKRETAQTFQFFSLFIVADTGTDGFYSWNIPAEGNQVMMFPFRELSTIAWSENVNSLTLWKFAKVYTKTSEKIKIFSMTTLDPYSIYSSKGGSLLHSDKANPFGGTLHIIPGTSNDFYREVQKDRDEHATLVYVNGQVGYTKVIRKKKYAPIYKDKFAFNSHRLVIEDFKMPIWITNYQNEGNSSWAKPICEAIAYWLHKMKTDLEDKFAKLKLVHFEIEIIIDKSLIGVTSFLIKEINKTDVTIEIKIDAPKIQLLIPHDFLYLVRQPDNYADKLLVRTAMQGIIQYTTEDGRPIDLSLEEIDVLIEKILTPDHAKMVLFADPTRNIRLDNDNLPSMRYLNEAEISLILDNLKSYLPKELTIPEKISDKGEKIILCDLIVSKLIEILKDKIKDFDGLNLLEWLIRDQERCVQLREFREILIPAKIACFSSIDKEVTELTSKEESLVASSYAIRTLIEFVATNIPKGQKWANNDEIDELIAIVSQIINWGAASEGIRFSLNDPEMGLLPSGRIGMEKTFEREVLEPYQNVKTESEIYKDIENFAKNYLPIIKEGNNEETEEHEKLDIAFEKEFGLSLMKLSDITGILMNVGFEYKKTPYKISKGDLYSLINNKAKEISNDEIERALSLLTLLEREDISKPPNGFSLPDIFPWHYTRPLSYLRRPLVCYVDEKGIEYYLFGFRHLMMYLENLFFLLYTGKLPERNSEEMSSWMGYILGELGKPFRNEVKEWFEKEKKFQVIEHEVTMKEGGHIEAPQNLGDIDVLVIDHENKIVYSIECKNSIGARNIHEIKNEMDLYLGRQGQEKKAKILKHVNRDKFLQSNREQFEKFGIVNPDEYQIKSFILTADEIPLPYLKGEALPLPMKSFVFLRKDGVAILDDI